jgi:hypothetical protein
VISGEAKTEAQLGTVLCRVDVAFRTAVDILDADLSGTGQIDALLSDPRRGSQIPRIVEELRLPESAERAPRHRCQARAGSLRRPRWEKGRKPAEKITAPVCARLCGTAVMVRNEAEPFLSAGGLAAQRV